MSQLELLTFSETKRTATYRIIGGPPRLVATFYRAEKFTDEQLARHEAFAAAVLALRPPRRAPRVNHARARAALEAAGARVLAQPEEIVMRNKWLVRIYYTSEGGELLCFDAGPFARVTADRVASEYKGTVFDKAEIGADAIAQGVAREPVGGARLVVLPSQMYENRQPAAATSEEP